MPVIPLAPGVLVASDELVYTASRSGGPGGQHVNKTSTRVTLTFDVAGSPSLTPAQKSAIVAALGSRLRGPGVLRVVSQVSRSQSTNREDALERLRAMIARALKPRRARKATRVPAVERVRRIESKRRRSEVKRARSRDREETD